MQFYFVISSFMCIFANNLGNYALPVCKINRFRNEKETI